MGLGQKLGRRLIGRMTGPIGTLQRELIDAWTALMEASRAGDEAAAWSAHLRLLAMGNLYFAAVLEAEDGVLVAINRGDRQAAREWQERLKVAVYLLSKPPYSPADTSDWPEYKKLIDAEAMRIDRKLKEGGDPFAEPPAAFSWHA